MTQYLLSARNSVALLVVPAVLWFAAPASSAQDIAIVSPRNQEMVQDNSGNVTVKVQARLGPRQRIRILLDGAPFGADSDRTTIALEGIDRGEHLLEALLLDEKDAVLATSSTITFHMWRASSQFPARNPKPKPKPPEPPPPATPKVVPHAPTPAR
jgi:hypothetical protein